MQTKLGVSAGLVAAAAFFIGLFGGWVPLLLIAGYVLIVEKSNDWLRMSVIKALTVNALFSLLGVFIGFIPDLLGMVNNILSMFNNYFAFTPVDGFVRFLQSAVSIVKTVLLLVLGFAALGQKTVSFGPVDDIINKHMLRGGIQ